MSYDEVEKILLIQLGELGLQVGNFPELCEKEAFFSTTMYLVGQILPPSQIEGVGRELFSGMGAWKKQMGQCKRLVELVKGPLGYREDVTFDNFLYPTEVSVRTLLSFLIEKVQRKREREDDAGDFSQEAAGGLEERIMEQMGDVHNESYTINWSKKKLQLRPIKTQLVFVPSKARQCVSTQNLEKNVSTTVFEDNLTSLTQQWDEEAEWNARGARSGLSREAYFANKRKRIQLNVGKILQKCKNELHDDSFTARFSESSGGRQFDSVVQRRKFFELEEDLAGLEGLKEKKTAEEKEKEDTERRDSELSNLDELITKLAMGIGKIDDKMETIKNSIAPLEGVREKEEGKKEKLDKEHQILETTIRLYENKDENLGKLKRLTSVSAQKLLKLAAEWEKFRVPKINRVRELRQEMLEFKNKYKIETDKIEARKTEMRAMIEEIKQKQANYNRLVEHYNSLPKDKDRKFYVQKILDIVRNISNQNSQIQKILFENRDVRDKIVISTGKAQHVYRELEERVFHQAKQKSDRISAELYKYLMETHEDFDAMIKSVRLEVDFLVKIRDLDSGIEKLQLRNDKQNTKKIKKDLKSIQKENGELIERLKVIKAKVKQLN